MNGNTDQKAKEGIVKVVGPFGTVTIKSVETIREDIDFKTLNVTNIGSVSVFNNWWYYTLV